MSKRFNREGSFQQRLDGRWEGRLAFTDEDGHRKRYSFYAVTEREARQEVRDAVRRLDQGEPAKDSSQTVGAWCEEWSHTTLKASTESQPQRRSCGRRSLRTIGGAARRSGEREGAHASSLGRDAMLDGGAHLKLKAVSELLGHSGTQITSDTYAHLTTLTARKALDALSEAIGL